MLGSRRLLLPTGRSSGSVWAPVFRFGLSSSGLLPTLPASSENLKRRRFDLFFVSVKILWRSDVCGHVCSDIINTLHFQVIYTDWGRRRRPSTINTRPEAPPRTPPARFHVLITSRDETSGRQKKRRQTFSATQRSPCVASAAPLLRRRDTTASGLASKRISVNACPGEDAATFWLVCWSLLEFAGSAEGAQHSRRLTEKVPRFGSRLSAASLPLPVVASSPSLLA